MLRGYARVSTAGQTLNAQLGELSALGCRLYAEKVSGTKSDRPQLQKLLRAVRPGDVVVVTRLDRLARSTRDLLNILAELSQKGAGFRSLADVWADTTTPHGRLMLTLLGGIAEFERELIRIRTSEGRARAKAMGVKMGRPAKLNRAQRSEVIELISGGALPADLARLYDVSISTISRMKRASSLSSRAALLGKT